MEDAGGAVRLVPDARQAALTVPERAVVAGFAKHFTKYTPGLERNVTITFPRIIGTLDCVDGDHLGSSVFARESQADQAAEVAANIFGLEAGVVQVPVGDGWHSMI